MGEHIEKGKIRTWFFTVPKLAVSIFSPEDKQIQKTRLEMLVHALR